MAEDTCVDTANRIVKVNALAAFMRQKSVMHENA